MRPGSAGYCHEMCKVSLSAHSTGAVAAQHALSTRSLIMTLPREKLVIMIHDTKYETVVLVGYTIYRFESRQNTTCHITPHYGAR
jgi:hypothetical protein